MANVLSLESLILRFKKEISCLFSVKKSKKKTPKHITVAGVIPMMQYSLTMWHIKWMFALILMLQIDIVLRKCIKPCMLSFCRDTSLNLSFEMTHF